MMCRFFFSCSWTSMQHECWNCISVFSVTSWRDLIFLCARFSLKLILSFQWTSANNMECSGGSRISSKRGANLVKGAPTPEAPIWEKICVSKRKNLDPAPAVPLWIRQWNATEESLLHLFPILLCIFSIFQIIFEQLWHVSTPFIGWTSEGFRAFLQYIWVTSERKSYMYTHGTSFCSAFIQVRCFGTNVHKTVHMYEVYTSCCRWCNSDELRCMWPDFHG